MRITLRVVEAVALVDLEDTVVLRCGTGHIVLCHLAASGDAEVGPLAGCPLCEKHVVPVVGRVDVRIGTRLAGVLDLVLAV